MAEQSENDEKPHEPTPKKLEDARQRGEIPRSVDLTTSAVYLGLLIVITWFSAPSMRNMGAVLMPFLERPEQLAGVWFDQAASPLKRMVLSETLLALSVWFLVPALGALICLVAQRAILFSGEKVQPKISRISIISNIKNKYGLSGLFEFLKSFVKLLIYSIILFWIIYLSKEDFISLIYGSAAGTLIYSLDSITVFFSAVLLVAVIIGALDYGFQRFDHLKKNRMSHQELLDELKQMEGDPALKQERRRRAYEIATNRMMDDVPSADVVIVNPTHFAVALKWDRAPGSAPVCVAKGVDEVAARIREIAQEHAVPIRNDPPAARAIHATVDIGSEVRIEHYQAVAAAVQFADKMRQKLARTGGAANG